MASSRAFDSEKTVLLFYREHEADKFFPGDRYLKRLIRPLYNLVYKGQKKSGFAVSFEGLRRGLVEAGYRVEVNNYELARRHPEHPVGLVGFTLLLDGWDLPNPVLLGPSLFDHPKQAPDLFADPRFRKYVVLADWMYDLFEPHYPDRCVKWFAGIDLDKWPDLSGQPKTTDFIIYDKVRWNHDSFQTSLIDPVIAHLDKLGLTHQTLRYKHHDHARFRQALGESRAMIFLCEHETQGLAYQEALASGVPILAWDQGLWLDPQWQRYEPAPPPAAAVPFFSPLCGERFTSTEEFPEMLAQFQAKRSSYDPRRYVRENLSLPQSGKLYADAYFGLTQSANETGVAAPAGELA